MNDARRPVRARRWALVIAILPVVIGADGRGPIRSAAGPGDPTPPVAIDLRIADGEPDTLRLIPGLSYRIDQVDLIATDERAEDDRLNALITGSSFADLDWRGLRRAFADTVRGLDGVPFFREIWRDAAWMTGAHRLRIVPRSADGMPEGTPVFLASDSDHPAIPVDAFPIRRPAVIREHRAGHYRAEALLQLRNASAHPPSAAETFVVSAATRSLLCTWEGEEGPGRDYVIPVEPAADPPFAYGFAFDLAVAGRPSSGAEVEPGDEIEVVVTFRDGAGARLHPPGALPTYNEFRAGLASGLRYFDFDQGVLFFRDKNAEGVLLVCLEGPTGRLRQIYTEVPASEFAKPQQTVALAQRDGFSCIWQVIPPADVLFGGLLDPRLWDTPVSDRFRFAIPRDALPGRYKIVGKARRVYKGESSLVTREVSFDVAALRLPAAGADPAAATGFAKGTPGPSLLRADDPRRGWVGRCDDCHKAGVFPLAGLLHGNGDVESCAGCHAPLAFEPDNMLAYRVHYVHYVSRRSNVGPKECGACHLVPESIERASLLVCLSCHGAYHGGAEQHGNYGSCAFTECHSGAHGL
jgi:hypothetical protein